MIVLLGYLMVLEEGVSYCHSFSAHDLLTVHVPLPPIHTLINDGFQL